MEQAENTTEKRSTRSKIWKFIVQLNTFQKIKNAIEMVYDKTELSYVYAELSFYNKAFDIENWDAQDWTEVFWESRKR